MIVICTVKVYTVKHLINNGAAGGFVWVVSENPLQLSQVLVLHLLMVHAVWCPPATHSTASSTFNPMPRSCHVGRMDDLNVDSSAGFVSADNSWRLYSMTAALSPTILLSFLSIMRSSVWKKEIIIIKGKKKRKTCWFELLMHILLYTGVSNGQTGISWQLFTEVNNLNSILRQLHHFCFCRKPGPLICVSPGQSDYYHP